MLIRSISGIRGLVEEDFDKDTILRYSNALHQVLNPGVIYAGRDSRESGEHIIEIMIEELIKLGRTIIYCGIVPTPTIQFMVHSTEAVGGFIVTASHNPIEWNGIKFVKENSTFFNSQDCEKLFERQDIDIHMEMYGEGTLVSELWKTKGREQHPKYEDTLSNIS